jgi:predicted 3-demethylubiquinone-9 3-methyltransferase (glyoxalase superfamily)
MQKIITHLWFDDQAEEAVRFYTSIFRDSKIGTISRYTPAVSQQAGRPVGSVMTIEFQLAGQEFLALNGGPHFKFNEAISLLVNCKDQAEIDSLWDQLLSGGGKTQACGWLKDKYGLSWQIVPQDIQELMTSGDPRGVERLLAVLMKQVKIDIAELKRAYEGR